LHLQDFLGTVWHELETTTIDTQIDVVEATKMITGVGSVAILVHDGRNSAECSLDKVGFDAREASVGLWKRVGDLLKMLEDAPGNGRPRNQH